MARLEAVRFHIYGIHNKNGSGPVQDPKDPTTKLTDPYGSWTGPGPGLDPNPDPNPRVQLFWTGPDPDPDPTNNSDPFHPY